MQWCRKADISSSGCLFEECLNQVWIVPWHSAIHLPIMASNKHSHLCSSTHFFSARLFSCSPSRNHQFVYKVFAVMSHLILVFPWTQRWLCMDLYPSMQNTCFLGVVFFLVMIKGNRFQKHHLVFGGVFLRLYLCVRVCVLGGWELIFFFLHSLSLGLQPPTVLLPKKGVSRQLKGGTWVIFVGAGLHWYHWIMARAIIPSSLQQHQPTHLLQNIWQSDLQTFNYLIYEHSSLLLNHTFRCVSHSVWCSLAGLKGLDMYLTLAFISWFQCDF